MLDELTALIPLAPLHEPAALAAVRAIVVRNPDLPQVLCFDTAFHRTNSDVVQSYALPRRFFDEGIRRYGFHGLSYEYIASRLPHAVPEVARGRVVVAHLGNGASLCALRDGISQASTMGFSVLDGVPMGTRPGELDAGVLLHLLHERRVTVDELQTLLYTQSGMLGLSGISADFRELEGSAAPEAAFAIEVFVYRVAEAVARMAAALGGIDALVFTGGIGEHSAPVRAAICERCEWLGVRLDPAANASHATRIGIAGHMPLACVIPTDEELVIARHTAALLAAEPRGLPVASAKTPA
jgi:acetate kinase